MQTAPTSPEPQAAVQNPGASSAANTLGAAGVRLAGIDALRGVAAVGVLLFHAFGFGMFGAFKQATVPALQKPGLWAISYGFSGVYLFFVISGFCIHLKWAKASAQGREAALDVREFFKRRVLRLYPAYLAAIVLSVLMLAWQGTWKPTPFNLYDVAMHLLLIHNLDYRIVYSLNNVFWTLAVEGQFYVAYFALLWMRKRWSWPAILLFCLALRVLWFVLASLLFRVFHYELVTTQAAPPNWFLWILGALSAEAAVGACSLPRWCRSLPLAAVALSAAALGYYLQSYNFSGGGKMYLALQTVVVPLWGLGFFVLVNAITAPNTAPKPLAAMRSGSGQDSASALMPEQSALQEPAASSWVRVLALVGLFSYSIYLTHEVAFGMLGLSTWVEIPLAVAFSWGFFLLFEKPFLYAKPNRPVAKATL